MGGAYWYNFLSLLVKKGRSGNTPFPLVGQPVPGPLLFISRIGFVRRRLIRFTLGPGVSSVRNSFRLSLLVVNLSFFINFGSQNVFR